MSPALKIVVDTRNGVPPWRQVRDQIAHLVEVGQLALGTRLPTIRQLASDLGLAPGTVARAYKELEADGVLHTARRHGTVIAAAPSDGADPLRAAAEQYVQTAKSLGVDERTATSLVQRLYDLTEETT
ncbi:GntR family transcriptional regulator [Tenggerimyces flavus]|uniref:GntR family transcriptional regulator n=1 Tax=Tenggerimyces flavus TaxID=1708749 RepID=A0ABV7YLT2_9ACTN|nr:GntR family transcriptional regulator [Tenggerimyces flavus]MBM7787625.1 DNA-binding transcriptional regulator YhcF (GntR family) [Tenggerimyces flavus]